MTQYRLFRVKNAMLIANLISNAIGVAVVMFISYGASFPLSPQLVELAGSIGAFFVPLSFLIPIAVVLWYERPIRAFLESRAQGVQPREESAAVARRRLLNEPFFLIGITFAVWLIAAVLYSWFFWRYGGGADAIRGIFFRNLYTGLITTTVAFFVLEFVLQRRLVTHFFTEGGLYATPGTLRIRIRARLTAMLFACNVVPFMAILQNLVGETVPGAAESAAALDQLRSTLYWHALIFVGVGVWVTFLVSSNLTRPLRQIIEVLGGVRNGRLDRRVRVTSNDEIGYTGDVINEMVMGLKEREFIKETFGRYVTEEIRDEILSGRVPLDGEIRDVTVLFADLRDYTPMVERTPPKEVVVILNGYFKEMDEAIRGRHGLVLQYIGDEVEAVFGAPIARADHPRLALEAALEMRRRLLAYNEDLASRGYPPLAHGIGIHSGEVVAANIGSPDRISYTLVGDAVNLASRIQDLTKEMGASILLSEDTRSRVGDDLPVRPLTPTRVKGKTEEVRIYALD